ncbi:Cc8L18.2-like protein [Daphnia magna]|uniref:Cc8L18.2-like protein n=1 Tax=Daphnia magna TaxID=35525 RepID=A0A164MSD3_9CRUS|nr:Cc8L18.2-like protein [Daphnia magna]
MLKLVPGTKLCISCMLKVKAQTESSSDSSLRIVTKLVLNPQKLIVGGTYTITAHDSLILKINPRLFPGLLLCYQCSDKMQNDIANQEENWSSQSTYPSKISSVEEFVYLSSVLDSTLTRVQNVCSVLEVSPVKATTFNKLNSLQHIEVVKRKADSIAAAVVDDLSTAIQVPYVPVNHSLVELTSQAADLSILMDALKEKVNVSSKFSERIQLLTLTPDSWSRERVATEFEVSEHVVRAARKLKEEKGILPPITSKPAGNRLLQTTIDVEAHYLFQQDNPNVKIGLSKFCFLRPKWCVTADSSGSHNVCVCIKHQNPKVMLAGADIGVDYKSLLELLVCSLDNESCMFGECSRCPSSDVLKEFLFEKLDDYESVTYSEWTTVDRTTLIKVQQSVEDFVLKLVSLLLKLRTHHFLSKVQAAHYKSLKEQLGNSDCLVTLDFAENYTFESQDKVQGAHWTNNQATVHPIVIYYKENEELISKSFSIISDSLKHDAVAVHSFIWGILPKIKTVIPNLKKVFFFSDGGPAHYKNRFNFAILSLFESDHGVPAGSTVDPSGVLCRRGLKFTCRLMAMIAVFTS